MEIVEASKNNFTKLWDEVLSKAPYASPFYSSLFRKYSLYYAKKYLQKDLSFIVLHDNDPVAICPLFLEKNKGVECFSYAASYLRAPIIRMDIGRHLRKKIEYEIFQRIDFLAKKNKVAKHMVMMDPLCEIRKNNFYNYFLEYGYLDSSIATQIVDLSKDKKQLWNDVRRRYKALINKTKRIYQVCIFDYNNPDKKAHDLYKEMHMKGAKNDFIRLPETYEIQFKQLMADEAMLLGLKYKGSFVGFSYFVHLNKTAYYASAARDLVLDRKVPLEHLILWEAIQYYKKRKFAFFELGWQQFCSQIFDKVTTKNIDIANFKKGLGGFTFEIFRGVKFYSETLFKKEISLAIQDISREIKISQKKIP